MERVWAWVRLTRKPAPCSRPAVSSRPVWMEERLLTVSGRPQRLLMLGCSLGGGGGAGGSHRRGLPFPVNLINGEPWRLVPHQTFYMQTPYFLLNYSMLDWPVKKTHSLRNSARFSVIDFNCCYISRYFSLSQGNSILHIPHISVLHGTYHKGSDLVSAFLHPLSKREREMFKTTHMVCFHLPGWPC